ncbi:hypothetical protein [Stieleria varia]|uniref:hypothetical protein n=1 Tax=Stieleria varia TaxID=2528005 RepID=UPI0011B7802E|nr:hypothetical protein [Stieleria varia]
MTKAIEKAILAKDPPAIVAALVGPTETQRTATLEQWRCSLDCSHCWRSSAGRYRRRWLSGCSSRWLGNNEPYCGSLINCSKTKLLLLDQVKILAKVHLVPQNHGWGLAAAVLQAMDHIVAVFELVRSDNEVFKLSQKELGIAEENFPRSIHR